MLVPIEWLEEYVQPGMEPGVLGERLALTGTEVDRVHEAAPVSDEKLVIGQVTACEKHPDADRLSVCTVDVGADEPSTIVCGAPNIAAGQTVAVALPGSRLPDGTKIKKSKLRGVASAGMILSERELGLSEEHDGIMVLDEGPEPGSPLAAALPAPRAVLELEITPNRPDCLGIYGVAREVHAATGAPLAAPPWEQDPGGGSLGQAPGGIEVVVEAPELCPRFTARVFEGVTVGPSPAWLADRLLAAGQRPINNIVDITNYVMLLCGHPLHAFDLDRISGGRLVVRRAQAGEKLVTLDGEERELLAEDCVIADEGGVTSLAGVMGGERSEVSEQTTRVLLEVAVWEPATINRTAQRLALRSEASARFEKGLPPEGALEALAVASALVCELAGATLLPGTVDVGGAGEPGPAITLREERLAGLLGSPVTIARAAEILASLGFGVELSGDGLTAQVPAFRRRDVTREADLIEEVARIEGFEDLPATLPPNRSGRAGGLTPAQVLIRRAEGLLAGRGLAEVVGWSFGDPQALATFTADELVRIENPMSEAQSAMRPSVLPSLLDLAALNASRGAGRIALFESGTAYAPAPADAPLPARERHELAAVLSGPVRPPTWLDTEPQPAGIFTARALTGDLMEALGVAWEPREGGPAFLEPGRAATVVTAEGEMGWFGEVHPAVCARWGLEAPVAALAIDLGRLAEMATGPARFEPFASVPPVREDLAVILPATVGAGELVACIREAGGELVSEVEIFDVYSGDQVGEGKVSLAVHVEFRDPERTLTDEDVAPLREKIVAAIGARLGGELRG
ncbi:MAG: phenylalanine--tRNA ligase subunit beta [Solirubrobacterales bacterium]